MPSTNNQILAEAEAYRSRLPFPFIAITGSNGKTTTRNMLSQILRKVGRLYEFDQRSDSAENIARELLELSDSYDWALVKIGAAAPGEIKRAAPLIRPKIAIITNVGEAHLAQHGSIDNIAAAKAELLVCLAQGGTAILNRDNEYTRSMGMELAGKVDYFGLSPVSDYYAADIQHHGPAGSSFSVHQNGKPPQQLKMAIYSLGDVYNALAAYAAAAELGIDNATICAALQNNFILPDGRGKMHALGGFWILDDTYDATPQSFYKSTKSLINFRDHAQRLIFAMGDMTRLAENAQVMHTMMGHYIAGMPIDIVVIVGHQAAAAAQAILTAPGTKKEVVECPTLLQAVSWLKRSVRPGDVILVEGGETIDMSAIVRDLVQFGKEKWGAGAERPGKRFVQTK